MNQTIYEERVGVNFPFISKTHSRALGDPHTHTSGKKQVDKQEGENTTLREGLKKNISAIFH